MSSVPIFQYPYDLVSKNKTYGKSMVLFYINSVQDFQADTSSSSSSSSSTVSLDPTKRDSVNGVSVSSNIVTETLEGIGESVGELWGDAKAALSGAWGALGTNATNYTTGSKTLNSVIALYIPHNLGISYNTTWQDVDALAVSMATEGISAANDLIGGIIPGTGTLRGLPNTRFGAASGADDSTKALDAGISLALLKVGKSGLEGIGATMGLAPNPMKEQVFRQVEFREFTMRFEFSPRNEEEAEMIQKILFTFKFHMHPHFVGSKFLYKYPSEFDVVYYFDDKENEYIHKHTSAVLSNMNVSYAPHGSFSLMKDGRPTTIVLDLQFKELMTLSKEAISLGL